VNLWVDPDGDNVPDSVDGAAKEVEAGTEIGDGGGSKRFDEGRYGLGLSSGIERDAVAVGAAAAASESCYWHLTAFETRRRRTQEPRCRCRRHLHFLFPPLSH